VSITFSRSLRSLQADRSQRLLWSISLAALLLIAWLIWFFGAHLIVYQTAVSAELQSPTTVTAYIADTERGLVQPGQQALLRLDTYPWTQYGTLDAIVTAVANDSKNGQIRIELLLKPDQPTSIPLQAGLSGTADIEIDRVTPAVLVLRAAGRRVLPKT